MRGKVAKYLRKKAREISAPTTYQKDFMDDTVRTDGYRAVYQKMKKKYKEA